MTVIRPVTGWQPLDLAELWRYRDLLWMLVRRDLRVRFRHPISTVLWLLLQAGGTAAVFALLKRQWSTPEVSSAAGGLSTFLLSVMVGLTPWMFWTGALNRSVSLLESNAPILAKVYFPRMLLPMAATVVGLSEMLVVLAATVILAACMGALQPAGLALLPALLVPSLMLATGASFWVSAVALRFHDFRYAIPFALQIGLFLTPVVFDLHTLTATFPTLADVLRVNPMSGVCEGFRSALLGLPWDVPSLAWTAGWAVVLPVTGAFFFRRMEHTFSESL